MMLQTEPIYPSPQVGDDAAWDQLYIIFSCQVSCSQTECKTYHRFESMNLFPASDYNKVLLDEGACFSIKNSVEEIWRGWWNFDCLSLVPVEEANILMHRPIREKNIKSNSITYILCWQIVRPTPDINQKLQCNYV